MQPMEQARRLHDTKTAGTQDSNVRVCSVHLCACAHVCARAKHALRVSRAHVYTHACGCIWMHACKMLIYSKPSIILADGLTSLGEQISHIVLQCIANIHTNIHAHKHAYIHTYTHTCTYTGRNMTHTRMLQLSCTLPGRRPIPKPLPLPITLTLPLP